MTKTSRVSKPSTYVNTYYFYTHPGTIKFHKIGHWSAWVREFGAPSNYNAETWESAHKWFVKRWIGRVQYNSTGMIAGLLRRNHVAESHRGSNVLDPKLLKKRPRSAYSVLNHIGNSRFKSSFLRLMISGYHAVTRSSLGTQTISQICEWANCKK